MKTRFTLLFSLWLTLVLVLASCEREDPLLGPYQTSLELNTPDYFPEPEIPGDNELTQLRADLGKRLFFDPVLSIDSTISCASCHKPELAFTDGRAVSLGVDNRTGVRNSPPVFNLAFMEDFFWDGGSPTLELQAIVPIEHPDEMAFSLPEMEQRIQQREDYVELFRKAYNEAPTADGVLRAVSAYQRSLVSYESPYDRYLQGDDNALTPSQYRGMELFFGERAECFHCHNGVLFTDQGFHNNGLYADYEDQGRFLVTSDPRDEGKFKVPTLRNIELTAPYMHDGSLEDLESVVEHYMSGGKRHPNQSPLVRRFGLNEQEKQDLVNFMKALTDQKFIDRHRNDEATAQQVWAEWSSR